MTKKQGCFNELYNLAKFCSRLQWDDIPEPVKFKVIQQVLINVSVAIKGSQEDRILSIQNLYQNLYGHTSKSLVWGTSHTEPAPVAAFLNAMSGHVLELDDVHTGSKTHIGTVVIPAAWALAEEIGAIGKDFLTAVICGYEVTARIGMSFDVKSHRAQGWHVTSTAGTFGAAAACAKLLNLDADKTLSAYGLAGTQSFGVWAFLADGADNKILHPARAAASGLESALLANSGMKGPSHILDAEDGGLFYAMTQHPHLNMVDAALGTSYELLRMDNKPYPCCRSTHCAIDAALSICHLHSLNIEKIERITIATYDIGYKQCGSSQSSLNPQKAAEAKFSTPFVVAAAICNGEVNIDTFCDAYLHDPALRILMNKIEIRPDENFTAVYPNHWGCELNLYYEGSVYTSIQKDAMGSVECPISFEQIESTAIRNLESVYGQDAAHISSQILTMDKLSSLPNMQRT